MKAAIALVALGALVICIVAAVQLSADGKSGDDSDDAPFRPRYAVDVDPPYVFKLDMPPRLQWNENYGYCGSTSMICAGMFLAGTYISQYDNRAIASNNTAQHKEISQLLLGVNDYWAAHEHKLTNLLWDYSDTDVTDFFAWIKSEVLSGHVVIIGIYENQSVFGQGSPDPDYDHIVPVTGWGSNHPLTDMSYYADDVIYFSDNGLYTPDGVDPVYHMSAVLSDFAKTRSEADKKSAGVYSVRSNPTAADPNFGISITGVVDEHDNTLRVILTSDVNRELPEIVDKSDARPPPSPMNLTVTVYNVEPNIAYNLYRYTTFDDVPSSQFNANAANAAEVVSFTGQVNQTIYQQTISIMSDQLTVFRAVAASAP